MEKDLVVSGKRKTAVAKATIKTGKGNVKVNERAISSYPELKQLELMEPLAIAKDVLKKVDFDIFVNVKGGGMASQIEAARLAMARAIVGFTKSEELKSAYILYDRNMLVADTRRKEAYKPGDSKARSKRQSSKR